MIVRTFHIYNLLLPYWMKRWKKPRVVSTVLLIVTCQVYLMQQLKIKKLPFVNFNFDNLIMLIIFESYLGHQIQT